MWFFVCFCLFVFSLSRFLFCFILLSFCLVEDFVDFVDFFDFFLGGRESL